MTLDITNNTPDTVIFDPREMIGILDLRSLGYCKIRQGVLQQNLSKYYHFKSTNILCEQFNTFTNALKKEKEKGNSRSYCQVADGIATVRWVIVSG